MSSASAAGAGGQIHGASVPAHGSSNPRKFSEKIALHTQRQAEETAAFQEVMMDLTSTRSQAHKVRFARTQGPYYGGSLPNVNQIGRSSSDAQASFPSPLDSSRSTRHHGLVERVQRDRRFVSPGRPYRRQNDISHSSSVYLTPPPEPTWRRRNVGNYFTPDKSQIFQQFPTTALNRTNSDSALHTSVMNPAGHVFSGGHTLAPQARRGVFSHPAPPIEENFPDDGQLLKPWDSRKHSLLASRPKSCEVPGITVFPSEDQQSGVSHSPAVLNTGGSLPDLSSLHFPSPLPTPLDPDEPTYPSLSGGHSTGCLTSILNDLGINTSNIYQHAHPPGLQNSPTNSSLQSSVSNPNIQSSLSSQSFLNSLSSASLHSSVSNPSLHSLSSSPSLKSSFSNQSLWMSPSNSTLSGHSHQLVNSSGYSGNMSSKSQLDLPLNRRGPPHPTTLHIDTRHHSKPFPPSSSPLSSITQGVALDTNKAGHTLSPPGFVHTQQLIQQDNNSDQQNQSVPPPHQSLACDLKLFQDALFLNSVLDNSYLDFQLSGQKNQNLNLNQQFTLDSGTGVKSQTGSIFGLDPTESQLLCHSYPDGCHLPSIILTGDSSGLSKEITSALSGVAGFEMDPFSSDDPLQMDPLALESLAVLTDGDLMLADPAVEESFRSDHLK